MDEEIKNLVIETTIHTAITLWVVKIVFNVVCTGVVYVFEKYYTKK